MGTAGGYSPPANVANASEAVAGLMAAADKLNLDQLAGIGGASFAGAMDTWLTDEIDFTISPQSISLAPKLSAVRTGNAGLYAVVVRDYPIMTVGTGTCTAGPTFSAGSDAANVNLYPANTPSAATVNASIALAKPNIIVLPGSVAAPFQLVHLDTAPLVKITAPATGTGGFTFKGRLMFFVGYAQF